MTREYAKYGSGGARGLRLLPGAVASLVAAGTLLDGRWKRLRAGMRR